MKIGVIGAGTMGHGIAQVCLIHGHEVILVNHKQANLDRAKRVIQNSLNKLVKKGTITEHQKTIALKNLKRTVDKNELHDREIIIEAIIEDINIKKELFLELDTINQKAVLASNTSTIPISKLQEGLKKPERVIGTHFMNPPVIMKLVEVVQGNQTNDKTMNKSIAFLKKLEKIPITVKDSSGFVVNRILMPMINEAAWLAQNKVAEIEDIDVIMEIGANQPIGPLRLADSIGIDIVVHILKLLEHQLKDPKYRPCPLLLNKLRQNKLGRKTGEGFYKY